MDVTSAIKVNQLSQELLSKGIASSSEEASAMAEKFLQKEMVHADDKPSEKMDNDSNKYEILIERMKRQVNNEFCGMKDQMNSLLNQINVLRNELNCLKKSPKVEEKGEVIEKVVEEPVKQEKLGQGKLGQEKPNTEDKKESENQRVGNLKPGDVKIESFFYCGDKK